MGNNFIQNIKPTDQASGINQFDNGNGCIVSLRSSESIGINNLEISMLNDYIS